MRRYCKHRKFYNHEKARLEMQLHRLFNVFVGSATLAGMLGSVGAQQHSQKYTIARFQLDAEKSTGVCESDYVFLEKFLRDAQKRISCKNPTSHEEAIATLRTMNTLVTNILPTKASQNFLSKGFQTGKGDCDTRTSLYLAVAEVSGLPLSAVYHPDHVFVRWRFPNGKYLNWETTQGVVTYDDDYERFLPDYRLISPRARTLVRKLPSQLKEYSIDAYAAWLADSRAYWCKPYVPRKQRKEMAQEVYTALWHYYKQRMSREPFSAERLYLRGTVAEKRGWENLARTDYNQLFNCMGKESVHVAQHTYHLSATGKWWRSMQKDAGLRVKSEAFSCNASAALYKPRRQDAHRR